MPEDPALFVPLSNPSGGAQRADLEMLRLVLIEALEEAPAAVKAQVAGQLRAVIKDLAALGEPVQEVSVADQLAARRATRRSGADDRSSASRRSKPRRSGGGNRTS